MEPGRATHHDRFQMSSWLLSTPRLCSLSRTEVKSHWHFVKPGPPRGGGGSSPSPRLTVCSDVSFLFSNVNFFHIHTLNPATTYMQCHLQAYWSFLAHTWT